MGADISKEKSSSIPDPGSVQTTEGISREKPTYSADTSFKNRPQSHGNTQEQLNLTKFSSQFSSSYSTKLGPKNCGSGAYNKKQKIGVLEPDTRFSQGRSRTLRPQNNNTLGRRLHRSDPF